MSETILQLGAGRFLRAFIDRFVQQANDAGQDVGQVAIVQSTAGRRAELLSAGKPYHVVVRGYSDGELVERVDEVNSVSRALVANEEWSDVVDIATSDALRMLVTNATEAGYVLDDCEVDACPPATMPSKLTQVLWRRFQANAGPLVILPCELIERNADKLFELVLQQADRWQLPDEFRTYVREQCSWLNNLVDGIVTSLPTDHPVAASDPAAIHAEPYTLLAIERTDPLPELFEHPAIKVVDDLLPYYLRKVRILNGLHTAMGAKFLPAGFKLVREVLDDRDAVRWVRGLLWEEIVPTIAHRVPGVAEFADTTYDRLRNPFIDHRLEDIVRGQDAKVAVRLDTTRREYAELFGKQPTRIEEVIDWRPGN